MKKFFCFALALLMLASFAGCGSANDANNDNGEVFADGDQYGQIGGELNILNWGEYIDESIFDDFEAETGIHVNYKTFASNEMG